MFLNIFSCKRRTFYSYKIRCFYFVESWNWVNGNIYYKINIFRPYNSNNNCNFILKEAWELITNDFSPLLDTKLLDEEIEKIETVLSDYKDVYFDYHELRTRRVGKQNT